MINKIKRWLHRRAWATDQAGGTSKIYNGNKIGWWQRHYRFHQRFRYYMNMAKRNQQNNHYL